MGKRFDSHEIAWTQDSVANLWGYYSTNRAYDAQYFSYHSGRCVLGFVKKRIPLAGRRVLDFGCGPGFMLGHLLREGIPCEGVEFSPESVDAVRRRFGRHPLFRGVLQVSDLPVPLADGSVDVLFLVEVVEHLLDEQLPPTMREMVRIVRRGGHVIVTVPNEEDLEASKVMCPECGCIFHRWQHQRSFTSESLISVMGGAGFGTVACRATTFGTGSPLDPVRRVYRLWRRSAERSPHLIYIGQKD